MSAETPSRSVAAMPSASTACQLRGYCGPFRNMDRYFSHPEPAWWGLGNCAVCGNTVSVAAHLARRRGRGWQAACE